MINPSSLKKIAIGSGVVLLLIIGAAFSYSALVFDIEKISPSAKNFPSSAQTIEITFNKNLDIDKNSKDQVIVSPDIKKDVLFRDKTIQIRLTTTLQKDQPLSVKLDSIASDKGDTLSREINFTVNYVPYSELPADVQEKDLEESDSFEDSYPLAKHLPLIAGTYEIDYQFPSAWETKMPLIITSSAMLELDPRTGNITNETRNKYLQELRDSRKEAIAQLNSLGYDPKLYRLLFSEPELVEEFGGTYLGDENIGE